MSKKDLVMIVYPVYRDKCFREEALVGQGFVFTDDEEGMAFQNYMNEHVDEKYKSHGGCLYWTNHFIPINVSEECWKKEAETWKMEEE